MVGRVSTLYLMECLGNMHSTGVYAAALKEYLRSRVQEMKDISQAAAAVSDTQQQIVQLIRDNPTFEQYRQCITIMTAISERMSLLAALCQ